MINHKKILILSVFLLLITPLALAQNTTVETLEATDIHETNARLNTLVESTSESGNVYFEYWKTPYTNETTVLTTNNQPFEENGTYRETVFQLENTTEYEYRGVATINGETVYGQNVTFTTIVKEEKELFLMTKNLENTLLLLFFVILGLVFFFLGAITDNATMRIMSFSLLLTSGLILLNYDISPLYGTIILLLSGVSLFITRERQN